MDCREFNDMILSHLDGSLRSDQSALMEAHAAQCAACACELALQSRLSLTMNHIGKEEITAPPELGSLVINSLRPERRGVFGWIPPSWRKSVAAAAAILLLAGSSAGVTAGLQIARQWQMVVLDPPAIVIDNNSGAPSGSEGIGTQEGMPDKYQDHNNSGTSDNSQESSGIPTGGDVGKTLDEGVQSSGATALLSNSTVITSTILNVDVADLTEARIKAVAFAAGSWASTQVYPEQNGDQKIVVLRLTVASDLAPGLIEQLSGLGTLTDRQDESRDITALYNETQVYCNDLESRRSVTSDAGELQVIDQQIASYRQQLNAWEAEAGKRVIMLWLES